MMYKILSAKKQNRISAFIKNNNSSIKIGFNLETRTVDIVNYPPNYMVKSNPNLRNVIKHIIELKVVTNEILTWQKEREEMAVSNIIIIPNFTL